MLTRKFPTILDGDQRSPSAKVEWAGVYSWETEAQLTRPTLYTALLDAEYEDSAALDHRPSLRVVESASDAWNYTLACGVNETKSVDGSLHIADERGYVGVARHYRMPKFEVVRQLGVVG